MSLLVPPGFDQFQWWQTAHGLSTRPAAAMGVSVTPGNNSKGSYATLISAGNVVNDVYGILIHINSGFTTATARDCIVDIGTDPAGGTSFGVVIPDLLGSCSGDATFGGHWYYFPLAIKAGSTIGARASQNGVTTAIRVNCRIFGRPTRPELCKTGSRVTAYGITGASSNGTSVTSGTTSEGSWTSLATNIAERNWWWQMGMGVNDSTMSALCYHADLGAGDATNKTMLIEDQLYWSDATERLNNSPIGVLMGETDVASGVNVYGRLQCSGTADAGLSLAGYGLGD